MSVNAAERCRRSACSHYYHPQKTLTLEMLAQHGFLEGGQIDWLPEIVRTPMSHSWRDHLTNRATDPKQLIERDDGSIIYFTRRVDELAEVAVARIWWEPLAVQLDIESTATGGARVVTRHVVCSSSEQTTPQVPVSADGTTRFTHDPVIPDRADMSR